jgi:hypothetical protein
MNGKAPNKAVGSVAVLVVLGTGTGVVFAQQVATEQLQVFVPAVEINRSRPLERSVLSVWSICRPSV